MIRKVLIVTPYFAPQTHAAVFRAYKLAKYLPSLGWEVHVLTVDTNYIYNEDQSLLKELPSSVKVHTARYVEPTPRGIGYSLGLSDRRFTTLHKAPAKSATATAGTSPARPPKPSRLKRWLLSLLNVPDAYWPWFAPALQAARRIARDEGIRLVFTSADPYTSHALGWALQSSGLSWVADLRDPHTHCHRSHSRLPWIFALQMELERRAALHADAVTVASQSIGMILKESYGLSDDGRVHFIPTGLDPALIPAAPAMRPKPYILFSGEYLADYGSGIFELFASAQRDPAIRSKGYEFLVVGRREVNEPRIRPWLEKLGIEAQVVFIDHMPQRELYALLAGAEFGTLCYGHDALWWCLPAKLVDFNALRKPVLAIVPNPSEARARLSETGLGVFLDGSSAQATFNRALLDGAAATVHPNPDECDRYLVSRQVADFSRVLETALAST